MRKYRRSHTLTKTGVYMKKRIAATRRRAKFVGTLYLLGTIIMAAIACLPLLVHQLAPVGAIATTTPFYSTLLTFDLSTTESMIKFVNSALYAVLLLAVVINALKALSRIGWLMKKSGNQTYGFNRNVYAMDDLSRYFSGSVAAIINTYLLIGVLCGEFAINTMMLIAIAVGVVLHLLCGFWGAKVAYYDYDGESIYEEKRIIGRFAPLFRNVLQIATVAVIVYFFNFASVNASIVTLLGENGINTLLGDINGLLVFAAQMVIILSALVLVKHATGTSEYGMEGAYGSGMKNFRVFSFFVFLGAAAVVAVKYVLLKEALDMNMAIVAGVNLVMFIIEIIMRKYPRHPEDRAEAKLMKAEAKAAKKEGKEEKKSSTIEGEFTFDSISRGLEFVRQK